MNSTLEHAGYIFNFQSHGAFDPNGKIEGELCQVEIDAHNASLARAELEQMVKKQLRAVCWSIRHKAGEGWRVVGCDINYEDTELTDEHTGQPIESAYRE